MTLASRDLVFSNVTKCAVCSAPIFKPKRKCNTCKAMKRTIVTVLPPSNKGRNARTLCLHKPSVSRTSRPKAQDASRMGNVPHMRTNELYR